MKTYDNRFDLMGGVCEKFLLCDLLSHVSNWVLHLPFFLRYIDQLEGKTWFADVGISKKNYVEFKVLIHLMQQTFSFVWFLDLLEQGCWQMTFDTLHLQHLFLFKRLYSTKRPNIFSKSCCSKWGFLSILSAILTMLKLHRLVWKVVNWHFFIPFISINCAGNWKYFYLFTASLRTAIVGLLSSHYIPISTTT